MSVKRVAVIGDVHGCIKELIILYNQLCYFSLDEINCVGDLIDRGPDSGEVVDFCREKEIKLVKGNHESTMYDIVRKLKGFTRNQDKRKTIDQINVTSHSKENWKYLLEAPYLRAVDDLNLLIVHAGVWPAPVYIQAENRAVCKAQAINPRKVGDTVWYEHMNKKNKEEGFEKYVAWQRVYCMRENLVYGHSVYCHPRLVQNPGVGWTYGIDTGAPFGGALTALIVPDMVIVQVPALEVYWTKKQCKTARSVPPPRGARKSKD